MRRARRIVGVGVAAVLAVSAAACSSDADDGAATTATVADTADDTAGLDGVDSGADDGGAAAVVGAAATLQEAEAAVVQVITDGTFVDPEVGEVFAAGAGSGFVVDPDGLVVTNQHVVSGAGSVQVRFSDDDEAQPARVLGVSECNDLAVLELTDPGPYPYLEWFEGEITAGTEIYAAGYPLGDPQYTLTRGVVSKTDADGDTSWSSVRAVIEHDAATQPGSSGGPLLSADGRVLGVHFASRDAGTGTNQFAAIPRDLVRTVSGELRGGNEETIGVNGLALFFEDDPTVGGVWVSGVTPGGPASDSGVLPGDIILELNGVGMTPGTMEGYCDVLRTATPGDTMSVVLYRADLDEVLRGEINGRGIEVPEPPAAPEAQPATPPAPATGVLDTTTFTEVFDDSGFVSMLIPPWWGDVDPRNFDSDIAGGPVPSIYAAPSIDDYFISEGSGLILIAVPDGFATDWGATDTLLDYMVDIEPQLTTCDTFGRSDYSNAEFSARVESFGCAASTWAFFAIQPYLWPDGWVILEVRITDDEDIGLIDVFLESLRFYGP